ncbi:minor histocompatibility antigen H13-like isoform X2 [Oscarella lobularis]|uniref:minor histocompatibility antigen H13-like isoform X2 n=1 Tax=Oscarella lobularis TaxID=121494 RepID=UPI003313464B
MRITAQMAETVSETNASSLLANETTSNATATANVTGRAAATPEGLATAYCSLVVLAIIPIVIGSIRSIAYQKAAKKKAQANGEDVEKMTTKDVAMFPVIASGALLSLYLFFTIFSKEYVNLLLSIYFFALGTVAVASLIEPIVKPFVPAFLQPKTMYQLQLTETKVDEEKKESDAAEKATGLLFYFKCTRVDLACLFVSALFGIWYVWKKHWIANNVFGFSFAIKGIEMLSLNSVTNGFILLGGLFLYDVFWVRTLPHKCPYMHCLMSILAQVFGTDVMVTVAKSFDAPIKLIFPMDILEHGIYAKNFSMLGLGDIVIPGIFIALLLRFEDSRRPGSRLYFRATCVAYFFGLVTTVLVMHFFNAAQPALLYLVPACLGVPSLVALVKGEMASLLKYEDHPSEEKEKDKEKTT